MWTMHVHPQFCHFVPVRRIFVPTTPCAHAVRSHTRVHIPCIQSQLVSAWFLAAAHADLCFAPSVFVDVPAESGSPAPPAAAGCCESDSVLAITTVNLEDAELWPIKTFLKYQPQNWWLLRSCVTDGCRPLQATIWNCMRRVWYFLIYSIYTHTPCILRK